MSDTIASPDLAAAADVIEMAAGLVRSGVKQLVANGGPDVHQVLAYEPLFRGTINSTSVYPRVVVQRVLELNAAAVVFAHQHPSGMSEPSIEDRVLTQQLQAALALIDVRVLDHIIVGQGAPFSFAKSGLL